MVNIKNVESARSQQRGIKLCLEIAKFLKRKKKLQRTVPKRNSISNTIFSNTNEPAFLIRQKTISI